MSLLATPTSPDLTPEQLAAQQRQNEINQKLRLLVTSPRTAFAAALASWQEGVSAIWDDPEPQAILDAFQAVAAQLTPASTCAELFTISARTAAFLEAQVPGSTADTLAKLKPFTVNPNGSITITPSATV